MKDKKIILAIAVVVILGSGLFLLRRKPTTSPIEKKSQEIMKEVEEANKMLEKAVPSNLKPCTPEILANATNCNQLPQEEVCGYDHTVYGDGREKDHGVPYKNACYYCQLFGEDGVMEILTTKVTALGHQEGDCR